jgi:hypothetical protein
MGFELKPIKLHVERWDQRRQVWGSGIWDRVSSSDLGNRDWDRGSTLWGDPGDHIPTSQFYAVETLIL